MGTGGAVIARGQQLVGCEETIVHYQSRPVWEEQKMRRKDEELDEEELDEEELDEEEE